VGENLGIGVVMFYNIKNFLKNIWIYRKFLWNDRWWDDYYIFFMLREKLKADVIRYEKYGIHLYKQDQIDKMKLCVKLLNRIINDEYLDRALLFYEKKYPDWLKYRLGENPEGEWFLKCTRQSDVQKQKDINYLFKYLSKHIQEFWD
jgi:hypothetical protein